MYFKSLLFLTALFFTVQFGNAQDTIYLKSGITDIGKMQSINKKVVVFKSKKTGKDKTYTDVNMRKAKFQIDGKPVVFTYHKVPFQGEVFLGKLISGKVDLFVAYKDPSVKEGQPAKKEPKTYYYARKKNDGGYDDLNFDESLFKSFKKSGAKYFKSCRPLYKKIRAEKLKKEDLPEIVGKYNTCQ